MAVRSAVGGSV